MSKTVLFTAPLLALGACFLVACSHPKTDTAAKKPLPVGYIVVKPAPLNLTEELAGRTSAFLDSDVRPQVGGIIKARLFTEGSLVTAGQSLYQIDPATYQAAYDSALASQQQAQANVDNAKIVADRDQKLLAIKAISQSDYDTAATALKTASAVLATAKAAVETAQINLTYTKVISPISGRIGKSSVTPGALVTADQTTALATVQDLSKIYVDITESSTDLLKLKQSLMNGSVDKPADPQVTLTLDDGSTYSETGVLQFSDVSVDPSTGSVNLRAVFANPQGLLMPGMYVRARIVKGIVQQGIMIPQTAVTLDPTGAASVLIAGDDNKAHTQPVVAGEMIGKNWQITSGLNPGDKVIVEGAMKLKPGGDIKASEVDPREGDAKPAAAGTTKTTTTTTHTQKTES